MLAGMGGVSYHRLVAAVCEAGGFGCLGASTMGDDEMGDEIAAVPGATDQALRRRPAHRAAPRTSRRRSATSSRAAPPCSSPGSACPARSSTCATRSGVLVVVNMCGKVRHAVAAVEAGCDIVVAQGTEAGGHTGPGRHDGARPPGRRRRGRPGPGRRRRRHRRRAGPGRRARPRRRRRVGRHPLHRHARGPQRAPATRTRCCAATRTTPSSPGPTPARRAG